MQRIIFRAMLKFLHWWRRMAARNIDALISSHGFDAVVRLVASLDGEDVIGVLRAGGAQVGSGTRISQGLAIHNANDSLINVSIGANCHLGQQVLLDIAAPITIGDRVTISMRSIVLTHTDVGDSHCNLAPIRASVVIEDDAYVGAGAAVLPGVRIGTGAVVAAGAVVTRDVMSRTVVAGCPARLLRPASRAAADRCTATQRGYPR
jgi:acetyltransferase-like isoleucine patch superfamily enzyme